MLMKADSNGATAQAFGTWRAMLPHWNAEADRFRRLAVAARGGAEVPRGTITEAEALIGRIRGDLQHTDMLMTLTPAGDPALSTLLLASAEFESILLSLETSADLLSIAAHPSSGPAPRIIAHRHDAAAQLA